ncbi:ferritin-like fold-containing protein [Arthrobacter roseus]|uniref:ferritin-like fold-containing protein n=1 Tax=Arthrobacter roseus TaxID=136274 RepID=UPI0019641C8E|nr:ferritin-like fold-containing protein [Arthrobacter roseus]MBM7849175.1 hypothetical protein [Arthrobacter roseus]
MDKRTEDTSAEGALAAVAHDYSRLLIDLFGAMAYGELSAFERLSSDARFSPTLTDRLALGRLAVAEFQHFELVATHVQNSGGDVEQAMGPFVASINAFHERTKPADWYESLMKHYVMDAVSRDFYCEIATLLDSDTRDLVQQIHSAETQSAYLLARLESALANDPRLASRLALWGRRLVGEALTRTRQVSLERGVVGRMLKDDDGAQLEAEISRIFTRLTRNHSYRMNALKLTA